MAEYQNALNPQGGYGNAEALDQLRKYADMKLNESFALQEKSKDLQWVRKLTDNVDTGQYTEGHYPFFGTVPPVHEWDGEAKYGTVRVAEKITHMKKWQDGLRFYRDDLKDAYGPNLERKVGELAVRVTDWECERFTKYICGGDGTTLDQTGLGNALFATDHSWGDSGANINKIGSNTSGGIALSAIQADFQSATRMFSLHTDDHGRPLPEPEAGYLIMCHPILKEKMNQFLNAEYWPSVDTGGGAVDNIYTGAADLWVNPWMEYNLNNSAELSNSLTWFIFRLDERMKPLAMLTREEAYTETDYNQDEEYYRYKLAFRKTHAYWGWLSGIQIGT